MFLPTLWGHSNNSGCLFWGSGPLLVTEQGSFQAVMLL